MPSIGPALYWIETAAATILQQRLNNPAWNLQNLQNKQKSSSPHLLPSVTFVPSIKQARPRFTNNRFRRVAMHALFALAFWFEVLHWKRRDKHLWGMDQRSTEKRSKGLCVRTWIHCSSSSCICCCRSLSQSWNSFQPRLKCSLILPGASVSVNLNQTCHRPSTSNTEKTSHPACSMAFAITCACMSLLHVWNPICWLAIIMKNEIKNMSAPNGGIILANAQGHTTSEKQTNQKQ